jgi:phosphoribosyl-AMP cyclohydrolase
MTASGTAVRPTSLDPAVAARLKRDRDGLVVAVTQQHDTGEVLMVGWMDDEAVHRTLTTGRCTYWSRSRQEYWVKGETSGAQQWVRSVALDCDGDTLLVRVDQAGSGACHTGDRTCFDTGRLDAVEGRPDEPGGARAPDRPAEPEIGEDTPAADPDAAGPS